MPSVRRAEGSLRQRDVSPAEEMVPMRAAPLLTDTLLNRAGSVAPAAVPVVEEPILVSYAPLDRNDPYLRGQALYEKRAMEKKTVKKRLRDEIELLPGEEAEEDDWQLSEEDEDTFEEEHVPQCLCYQCMWGDTSRMNAETAPHFRRLLELQYQDLGYQNEYAQAQTVATYQRTQIALPARANGIQDYPIMTAEEANMHSSMCDMDFRVRAVEDIRDLVKLARKMKQSMMESKEVVSKQQASLYLKALDMKYKIYKMDPKRTFLNRSEEYQHVRPAVSSDKEITHAPGDHNL